MDEELKRFLRTVIVSATDEGSVVLSRRVGAKWQEIEIGASEFDFTSLATYVEMAQENLFMTPNMPSATLKVQESSATGVTIYSVVLKFGGMQTTLWTGTDRSVGEATVSVITRSYLDAFDCGYAMGLEA